MTMTETQVQLTKDCATPGCDGQVPFDLLNVETCTTCTGQGDAS